MRTQFATAFALAAGFALVLTAGLPDPDARALTRDLDADRAAERDAAAQGLLAMGPAAVDALEDTVDRGSPGARRRARALLALIEDGDERPDARRREADAIVHSAVRRDGAIREGSPHDRRLGELGAAGTRAVARAVRREATWGFVRPETGAAAARHPSADALTALAGALHADRVLGSTLVELTRTIDVARAPALSDAARKDLRAVLDAPADPRRRGAAALLALYDDGTAFQLADDPDPRVRIEVARALGKDGRAAAGRALETLAVDDDPSVRRAALEALRDVPGRPRPAAAHANAEHPDAGVRAAAAELLARDAVPASLVVLHRLSRDRSIRVRAAADRALIALRRRARAAAR